VQKSLKVRAILPPNRVEESKKIYNRKTLKEELSKMGLDFLKESGILT
jgi:hypothetical protein